MEVREPGGKERSESLMVCLCGSVYMTLAVMCNLAAVWRLIVLKLGFDFEGISLDIRVISKFDMCPWR